MEWGLCTHVVLSEVDVVGDEVWWDGVYGLIVCLCCLLMLVGEQQLSSIWRTSNIDEV